MTNINFDLLVDELKKKHNCHTVILYGSYADNTHTENSDIDIICIGSNVEKNKDARDWSGLFLDAWVYPEDEFENLEDFLHLAGGKVLTEENYFGTLLLEKINSFPDEVEIDENEVTHIHTWCKKMLKRAQVKDIEGNYRKNWLTQDLLMIYFNVRGIRFKGSKKSFEYLKANDYVNYVLFEEIYQDNNDLVKLENLVKSVFEIY